MKNHLIRFAVLLTAILILSGCYSLRLPENADMTPDTKGNWTIKSYVDDYGRPTDQKYVETSFIGTFSNTATRRSDCVGLFRINDSDEIEIVIYEYGSHRTSGYGMDDIYYLTVFDDNDNVLATAEAWLGNTRFTVMQTNAANDVIRAISTHDHVQMRLSGGKYVQSTYWFGFDTTGFASKAQEII